MFSPFHIFPDFIPHGCFTSKCTPLGERINFCNTTDSSLEFILKEHYKLDSIGVVKKDYNSIDDQRAIDILNKTTRRLSSGQFETGLLWRDLLAVKIPCSYGLALQRFRSLENKFRKDKSYADAYSSYIQSIISKGYAELCTEPPMPSNVTWYLPHFGVLHPLLWIKSDKKYKRVKI